MSQEHLSEHSTVFEVLLKPGNEWKENQTGELKIVDFPLKTVLSMLEFIYTHQLSNEKGYDDLLLIADKYDMKSLLGRCETELASELCLENVLDLLELSRRTSASQLIKTTIQFIGQQDDVIRKQSKYNEMMTAEDRNWLEIRLHGYWQEEISRMEAELMRWDNEMQRLRKAIRDLEVNH